ncbi:suppressor of Mek1-like [Spodoptera litura]|uniref:Suppressor of Mek1-like n=1 Tax=Spodoptera litura TaxID=69820 RepID=A0A9J7DR26_SPOLT|nr:suppressor of Mek1-like [Spodoptera litura]
MQCFICVTYMIILCSANPTKTREIATTHEKRSLFRDVIESLRIHSQLPEEINQNDENNLSQNFVRYDNEPAHLPSDTEYIPRRNDRIEMPSMKYRFPKSIDTNISEVKSREEVVVFIDTNRHKTTTSKPKKDKRPRPPYNKNKNPNKNKENEDNINEEGDADTDNDDYTPLTNTMAGQSQIGNRESQTVLKPTVIVNIRGTVTHRDSDIRIEGRDEKVNRTEPFQNIFNINQEIKIEKEGNKKKPTNVKQEIKLVPDKENAKMDEDMMMCETATWKPDKNQETRKFDSVLQILFSI